MTCEHGFIGACAVCDGSGQMPEGDGRPYERRCECGHLEAAHQRYDDDCGECDCEAFVLDYPVPA